MFIYLYSALWCSFGDSENQTLKLNKVHDWNHNVDIWLKNKINFNN